MKNIRKVWWKEKYIEGVISLMRSYDKECYSLFKVKITELYLSFLLCPSIYYMKRRWSIFIWKFISYVRTIWIVWRLFYQIWHIHKIFDLHAFLLKAHGALKPYWASQLTLLYFSAQVLPGSSESIRSGKDSMFSRFVRL